VRKTAKYTWQNYKRNEDILSKDKIKPVVKEIQNYRKNGCSVLGVWTDRLAHLFMKCHPCKDDPSEDLSAVSGTGTGHEP
jgi:hypothetical protein